MRRATPHRAQLIGTTRPRKPRSEHSEGSIVALVAISLVPLVIGLAVIVDSGRVWRDRIALQNSVEAAAANTAVTWMNTGKACTDESLNVLSADDSSPMGRTCTTSGNNRHGTVTVTAEDSSPLHFVSLIGRSSAAISASTTARLGTPFALTGAWPIALCESNPGIVSWKDSGFSLTSAFTITVRANGQNCGGDVTGNWGVLDFNGGNNSTSELREWVQQGYSKSVTVGDVIPGNPGAITNSIGISSMIGNSITMALFDEARSTGNNAEFRISGFARATLLGARLTGGSANRSLTLRFETAIIDRIGSSVGEGSDFGITTWAICAYDEKGKCT